MKRDKKGRFEQKYLVNEGFLDFIGDVNSFFIGLMASDGNVKNNKTFSISQSGEHGLHLIKFIQNKLSYNGEIYHKPTTHEDSHQLTITSKYLVKKLSEHNVTPNKSFTYTYNRKALLNTFLQGYVEGDGCVGIYNSSTTEYYYISFFGNEQFKNSIIDLLPIKPIDREINDGYYELKFLGEKGVEFSEWLWKTPIYNNSLKYNKFLKFKDKHLKNTRYFKYRKINSEIIRLLNEGIKPKDIANELNISKRTVYNLKYNIKNGRNTY